MSRRTHAAIVTTVFLSALFVGSPGHASDVVPVAVATAAEVTEPSPPQERVTVRVPIFTDQFDELPIAMVNDETVLLGELVESLAAVHMGVASGETAKKKNLPDLVDRLIKGRLIIQEAIRIGLDQHPGIQKQVEAFRKAQLNEPLLRELAKTVEVDQQDIETTYKGLAGELKISALYFDLQADARAFAAALKSGKDFDALMEKTLLDKKAKGGREDRYLSFTAVQPQIVAAARGLDKGAVSPVIALQPGFAIFRLDDIRYPENAELRQLAKKLVTDEVMQETLGDYRKKLQKKYMKVNDTLVKSLNFDASVEAFEKLTNDQRVIATVKGGEAVTVADLAQALREKFYHGVGPAIQQKKLNSTAPELLEGLYTKRLLYVEALQQGIDKRKEVQAAVRQFEESLIFGIFVEKVLRPEVKLDPSDIESYYQEHLQEFTTPERIRFEALAFSSGVAADAAADKLRKGVDFKWMKANADDQVKVSLVVPGEALPLQDLPEGVRKALSGAQPGDYRVYADQQGAYHVLSVVEVIPSVQLPLEAVQQQVIPPVYQRKLNETLDSWTERLRAASTIEYYIVF